MEILPKSFLNKYRPQIGIFLVVVIVGVAGVLVLTTGRSKPREIGKISEVAPSSEASDEVLVLKIKIDVAGAVASPGVYELAEDGRVEEALSAAGGLAESADRGWVSKNLNLAAKLSDGDKLYIPEVGETESVPPAGIVSGTGTITNQPESASGGCSRVNINTASAATLADCLSGIGTSKAQGIIKYREDHGGFKSIGEIQEVSGIGPKTFEKLKDQITVD